MRNLPYATEKETSYENFIAKCPLCGYRNIFNRVTDLEDCSPIDFRTVSCFNDTCKQPFNINGDSASSAYRTLLLDCYQLLKLKQYMNCILTVTQAYEVFFSLFLRVELLYKPFAQIEDLTTEDFNTLSGKLEKKVKSYAFHAMRNLFIQQLIDSKKPRNLKEIKDAIGKLEGKLSKPNTSSIEAIKDKQLAVKVKALLAVSVGNLRNRVVHKQAYRPSKEEAENAIKEARSLLFPLSTQLNLYDDINWYMR